MSEITKNDITAPVMKTKTTPDDDLFWKQIAKHRQRVFAADAALANGLNLLPDFTAQVFLLEARNHIDHLLRIIGEQHGDVM